MISWGAVFHLSLNNQKAHSNNYLVLLPLFGGITGHCSFSEDSAITRKRPSSIEIHGTWKENNKREWKPPIHSYTKWAHELFLGYCPLTSAIKSRQTCETLRARGWNLFPTLLCLRTSRRQLGENWWGSRRPLTWFSLIWSHFQFLVIIDYFWVKKPIESIMLYALTQPERELLNNRYGTRTTQHSRIRQRVFNHPIEFTCSAIVSPNMRDFASQRLWPIPDDIFNFFV